MSTILVKIDVSKIDKSKLFHGKKGTYLDVVLISTRGNRYGDDFMAVQGVTKEEREKGIKGAILGNGRLLGSGSAMPPASPDTQTTYVPSDDSGSAPKCVKSDSGAAMDEDVPF